MRLCANENVPGDCVTELRRRGHDVLWVLESAPRSSDAAVLAMALRESRLLLTFDTDFGELVYRRGATASCGIVLFRMRMRSPSFVADRVAAILASRDDWQDKFSVVDDAVVRMRSLPRQAD